MSLESKVPTEQKSAETTGMPAAELTSCVESRKMSSIEQIIDITNISFLKDYECAQILGYSVAAIKGKFSKGDLVIYHQAGSVLASTIEVEAMRLKGGRVYTRSINGFVSEGLIMPLSSMKTYAPDVGLDSYQVGQDVTTVMGTTRQQIPGEDVEASLKVANLGDGRLPYGVPKTRQERGERCTKVLKEMETRDIIITTKQDGRSDTRCYNKGEYYFAGRTQVVFDTLEIKKMLGLPIPDWATLTAPTVPTFTEYSSSAELSSSSIAPVESSTLPTESLSSTASSTELIPSSATTESAYTETTLVSIPSTSTSAPSVVLPTSTSTSISTSSLSASSSTPKLLADSADSAKSISAAKQERKIGNKLKKFKPQDMLGAPISPRTSVPSTPSVADEAKVIVEKSAKPEKIRDAAWLEKINKLKEEGQAKKQQLKVVKYEKKVQDANAKQKKSSAVNTSAVNIPASTSLLAEEAATAPGEKCLVLIEKKYHFQTVLTRIGRNVALQGELCGPKINHNRMQLNNFEYYLFDVYDLDNKCYLGQDQVDYFAEKLGCPTAPVYYRGKFVKELFGDVKLLREVARAQRWPIPNSNSGCPPPRLVKPPKPAKPSKASKDEAAAEVVHLADTNGIFAEGIVLKTDDSGRSGAKRHSMKIHNTNYLRIYELDGYSE